MFKKNSLKVLAALALAGAAQADVHVVNHELKWTSLMDDPHHSGDYYVEFQHPQGNFTIDVPLLNHIATDEGKPATQYTNIRIKKRGGLRDSLYLNCNINMQGAGTHLTVSVHKNMCTAIRGVNAPNPY